MADQGSYNAIASGVNKGANPASQQSKSSSPTATQKGLSTIGTLGTLAGMNPAVGIGLSTLGAVNTYGAARQQDLGFLDSLQSAVAGTLPGSVLGIQSPLEQSIAMNKGNMAAPTPYSSGITAHSPSVPNSTIATGRKDYQGAPISSSKGISQQQQDVLDAVTAAAQQSLASKGNLPAPVGYSSGITATGNLGIDALNAVANQQSSTPSIAGAVSQANQATAPTATGGPKGLATDTASVGSPPGMSNKGLSLGDIPGISTDIANMTMDLSPIASQVSQATTGTSPTQSGGGMSSDAMGELAGMAAAEAQEADEASGSSSSSSSGSTSGGAVGGGGAADAHFNLGGMVGYQTNDSLKDLMRGYF